MEFLHGIIEWIHWLKDWVLMWADTPYAMIALFLIAFAESSFFPIPPDLLLIAMAVSNPKMALVYALICLAGSTTGGMLGYLIGLKFGKPALRLLINDEKINQVHEYFQKYEEWAIGIAGFTPVPYKVFSIGAGVFFVDFKKFVLVTILSRGARFFLVAGMIMAFGTQIKGIIDKYFDKLTLAFTILLLGGFAVMKLIKIPPSKKKEETGETTKESTEESVKEVIPPVKPAAETE